jgi:metallophosphoesterase superfamily enzyme
MRPSAHPPSQGFDHLTAAELRGDGSYLLLSDLHLGDGTPSDQFGRKDEALLAMLDQRADRVDAVILAGDVFDAFQALTADRIAAAHPRVIEGLEALARRMPLHHVMGNHDHPEFVRRLLPSARPCRAAHLGDEALVIHGHEFDHYMGQSPLSGRGALALRAHALFERLTGQSVRLPFGRHPNPANRFAHWIFYRYTMADHALARFLAEVGRPKRLQRWAAHHDYWARSQWGDGQALLLPALAALAAGPFRVLAIGHSHQAGLVDRFSVRPTEQVTGEPPVEWRPAHCRAPDPAALRRRTFANLGSWTFGDTTFGEWRGGRLSIRDFAKNRRIDDRAYRLALADGAIPGMREWWERYYRGLWRYDLERVRQDRSAIS